ncbi:EamA family transporter [Candidatus Parcubacteria bacterium]|nr:EamA family transporter [Candidatus Parcubacteria bacterium]
MKIIAKFDKRVIIGAGAIMLAALLWSLDGVFIRPKLYAYPAPLIVFIEHALGFLVLSPFIIFAWHRIKRLRPKDWGAIVWVSVFGGLIGTIAITNAFFAAMDGEVTFATVIILQKLQPVFALIMARLILGEKLSKSFYVWAAVAVGAGYALAFGKHGFDFASLEFLKSAAGFAVLAAFAFGSSTVFGKRIVNHLDFPSTTALRFGITSVLALILIIINKDIFSINSLGTATWGWLVLIVFSSGAVAMFVYYYGLKRISASVATICELFWPLSAVILDYIINKNVLNTTQIISSLILLIAFFQIIKTGNALKNFKFKARVITGLGRGHQIGSPTINLDKVDLDINHGIYAVKAIIGDREYKGLMHFGRKETYNEPVSLELYIKEDIPDLKSEVVEIVIQKRLRNIKKFKDSSGLQQQIKKDMEVL